MDVGLADGGDGCLGDVETAKHIFSAVDSLCLSPFMPSDSSQYLLRLIPKFVTDDSTLPARVHVQRLALRLEDKMRRVKNRQSPGSSNRSAPCSACLADRDELFLPHCGETRGSFLDAAARYSHCVEISNQVSRFLRQDSGPRHIATLLNEFKV